MNQSFDKYLMFKNRLQKVWRHTSKQAARQHISCFRVYDHDLPEFPFLIEYYEGNVYAAEYKRKHSLSDKEHETWLEESKKIIGEILNVPLTSVFLKLRQRKEHRKDQYQKLKEEKWEIVVEEGGLKFIVNLSDYLDTGLFLDHRITRSRVKELACQKRVLNLFCYTGSFSVYAAAGGASKIVSVDLSKTYLDWAQKNMALNFADFPHHELTQADVVEYLKNLPEESFDLIVMDPPTFSNSKRMDDFLDIQRDHATLINNGLKALSKEGLLIFSTNFSKFKMDYATIQAHTIQDITRATTPFDFEGKLKRFCFKISK